MSEYDVAIRIAGKLDSSFKGAIAGAKSGLTGLGISGKAGALALKGVGIAAKATAAGLVAAGGAIAAVGTYAVKVGREFEAQMSTVAAISRATADELEALSAKAKELGESTVFSATEVGKAMEYASMAGWSTTQMLSGIEGILALAAASGEDLACVSDIVTDALTAFGKGAEYSSTFADQLAAASSNANVSVATLGESFKYAAPIAGALGFSTGNTAEALALMGNAGIKASQAGTSMRATLNALTASELKFATSSGEVVVATQNADGTMRDLKDILDDSRAAFADMTSAQKAQAAKTLVGKNAMSGFLALMNAAPGDIEKVRSAIENSAGAAEEMANIRLDNLEGDITLLKSTAESFGIAIYEHMEGPLRDIVQYGKEQLGILSDALREGGFEGLVSALGTVLSDAVAKIAENAPAFIDGAASLIESLVAGLDDNSSTIGKSIGRLINAIGAAVIKLAPRIAVMGIHILIAIGEGIIDNIDILKDAAIDAVTYLWESIKEGFASFGDFLGDDSVEPFKKVLALIPAFIAGFAIFDGIGGSIKGFVQNFKGAGKALPGAAKGFTRTGSKLSKFAANVLAVGAGLALAAAGVWLLVEAAKEISNAGPKAVVALVIMAGAVTALMVVACTMGKKLDGAAPGLLAFGGAILMAAGGMALMSVAAIELSKAGPGAYVALGIMVGGMIALLAIAGSMGTTLSTAAAGLLAFGGALLLCAGAFALLSFVAVGLSQAGAPAIAVMFGLVGAIAAFMVVASVFAPMLTTAGVGMITLGIGLVIAAAGMAILTACAIALTNAGAPTIIMLAGLAAGILAFGAAAGVLSPLLIAGGIGLMVFGAGLAVVAAAAVLASASLFIISGTLPMFATYGVSAAAGIMAVGAALVVLGAGALTAGAGALVAAAGIAALGAAGLLAMIPMGTIGDAFENMGVAAYRLSTYGEGAADALDRLTSYGLVASSSLTTLAAAFEPLTSALIVLSPVAVLTCGAFATLLLALRGIGIEIVRISAGSMGAVISIRMLSSALTLLAGTNVKGGMSKMSEAVARAMERIRFSVQNGSAAVVVLMARAVFRLIASVRSGGVTLTNLARSIASGIRSAFTIDLTPTGIYMMGGLIRGMDSMRSKVEQAAREVAKSAADSVNTTLKIHSPSRLMMESGEYTGEGLALGMQSKLSSVQKAASSLTEPITGTRSSVFTEILSSPAGTGTDGSYTINFNPTYVIEGNTDKETLEQTSKLTLTELERMLSDINRRNRKVGFA